jgi:hypothetical protein
MVSEVGCMPSRGEVYGKAKKGEATPRWVGSRAKKGEIVACPRALSAES